MPSADTTWKLSAFAPKPIVQAALEAVPVMASAGSLSTIRLKIVRTVSESSTIITRIAAAAPARAKGRRSLPSAGAGGGVRGMNEERFTQTRQAAT